MKKTILCAAALAILPFAGMACEKHTVHVEDSYARMSGKDAKTAAAFMAIGNHTDKQCTLIGASTDVAEMTELHTHKEENGVMKMMKAENGFTIPSQGQHLLDRGGDHVMMMNLKSPLKQGDTIKMTLDFGDCGKVEADIPVDNERTEGLGGHGHEHKH